MLDKIMCKRCFEKEGAARWNGTDDKEWELGGVWCPVNIILGELGKGLTRLTTSNKREPPSGCPYVLEHTVIESEHEEAI